MVNDLVEISKKKLWYSVILLVVIIVLAVYLFPDEQPKENPKSVEAYKKAIYDSLICQYSCDLVEGEIDGMIQKTPNGECINECVGEIRATGFKEGDFSTEELLNDDLFQDTDLIIEDCRAEFAVVEGDDVLPDFNSFYNCAKDGLEKLKGKYPYLN